MQANPTFSTRVEKYGLEPKARGRTGRTIPRTCACRKPPLHGNATDRCVEQLDCVAYRKLLPGASQGRL
jgi:hypothetical protein